MYFRNCKLIIGGICAIASTLVAAIPQDRLLENPPPGIKYTRPSAHAGSKASTSHRPWTKPNHIHHTQNVQTLHGVSGSRTNSRSVAAILGDHQRQAGGHGYENITVTNAYGTSYAIQVVWDGFPMFLIIDTGSSDTWAVRDDFSCLDYSGAVIPQSKCEFGPAVPNPVSHYEEITPEQHMYVNYADGEIVVGKMEYYDITVANITVVKQQSCLANTTYWFGNNFTSGLMGLAYPSLTNSYLGPASGDNAHDPDNQVQYSPFFKSMISQGKLPAPLFSMAIDRNASTGVISWGGIPPVSGLDMSQMVSLDIIIASLIGRKATAYQYSFYTIIIDGWQFGQTTNTAKNPYIIDSGTTLCYLPPDLADAVAASYSPKAVYLWRYGAYFTDCNAVIPTTLAVILGGVKFFINPVDLIYKDMRDPETGLCMTAFSTGGSGPYILGDVFMQNALVIFDHGEDKMRFVPRVS